MDRDDGGDDYKDQSVTNADHSKTKGPAAIGKGKDQGDHCTICLEPVSERAVAVPCNHLTFDFLCLVSWLQERDTCPLCNSEVEAVEYDWKSPEAYKTYRVPKPGRAASCRSHGRASERHPRSRDRRRIERWTPHAARATAVGEDPALQRRRQIYRDRLYSLHVGANRISRYRDFTSTIFATSPDLQSCARAFLRRELKVFTFLDTEAAPRRGNREFLIEYIIAVLKTNELKGASGHAEDLISEFLGRENARQSLHELESWLRSPYPALSEWDEHVQYADRGNSNGVVKNGDR
ncbi:hypothetical protein B0A50_06012 [Salinomyces thailandicus]|uniref:RING-type E3 ubiquitin transferase n=1 Tax=Salinomyces thailandicus TaxID=706561 RepID=A0A4U0TQ88_9PEZI|nr:hypothetical protein B0A50_06012 [Salinomyces thailandica]